MSDDAPDFERELATQVLQLRRAGVQFDVIAERLKLSPETAKALFDRAIGAYDVEHQRALEADRLDRLHMAVWPQAIKGDHSAIDRIIKISERRDRVVAVPKANDGALRQAFDASALTSGHLTEVDGALVEAGRKIADRVDEAVATGEGVEVTKALYLVPHMLNVLREMLATPASRANAGATADQQPKEGKLAQLRAIQGAGKRTG